MGTTELKNTMISVNIGRIIDALKTKGIVKPGTDHPTVSMGEIVLNDSPVFDIIEDGKVWKQFKVTQARAYYSGLYHCERCVFRCVNIKDPENQWGIKDGEIFYYSGLGEWILKTLGL